MTAPCLVQEAKEVAGLNLLYGHKPSLLMSNMATINSKHYSK
jgi:hypothetical protein